LSAQRVAAVELGGQQVALGIQDVELAGNAVFVTEPGETQRVVQRRGAPV